MFATRILGIGDEMSLCWQCLGVDLLWGWSTSVCICPPLILIKIEDWLDTAGMQQHQVLKPVKDDWVWVKGQGNQSREGLFHSYETFFDLGIDPPLGCWV